MSVTGQRWLGWACVLVNGLTLADGLLTGSVGGLGGIVNPDSPPAFATRPATYLGIMGIYLALVGLGVWLIIRPAPATTPVTGEPKP